MLAFTAKVLGQGDKVLLPNRMQVRIGASNLYTLYVVGL
jgi:hypothetical protein